MTSLVTDEIHLTVGSAPSPPGQMSDETVSQYDRMVAWLLVAGENGPFTLVVTSSVSGEGVSSVCAGLACALARTTSKQIVLLDANLRAPKLHELFGVSLTPGLHEYLAANEHRRPDTAKPLGMVPTGVANLSLVPSGVATSQPGHLMTSAAAKEAVRRLRQRCDYILIDCPPVLSAAEAPWVCRLADGVVIVVRAGLTPRDDVKRAQRSLEGAPVIGVVLNGV